MSVQVTFAGVNYTVPEEDDSGWADLTAYLVALSDAAVGTTDKKSGRIATTSPVTVSATEDYAVGVNVASPATVTLPAGVDGQVFVVYDASLDAANNNITIGATGGQLINGLSSYSIDRNGGAVVMQFVVSGWKVIGAVQLTATQNQTNLSIIDGTFGENSGVTVAPNESCTFIFSGAACRFVVEADTSAMECACSVNSNIVDALWDTDSIFLHTDAGTGVVVTKSGTTVTVKSRLSTSALMKIRVTIGAITAATAWS